MGNVAAALALAAVSIFGMAGPAIAQEQLEHPPLSPSAARKAGP